MYNNSDPVLSSSSQPPPSPTSQTVSTAVNSLSSLPKDAFLPDDFELRQQYHNFFEYSPFGVFRLTANGKYLKVNSRFAQWHGYDSPAAFLSAAEAVEPNFFENPQQYQDFLNRLQKQENITHFIYQVKHPENKNIWLELNLQVFQSRDNRIYYEGYAVDITNHYKAERDRQEQAALQQTQAQQLQQMQNQLMHSEKLASLGQLLAGIAHEINNPVSFIYSNIEPAAEYATDLMHLLESYQAHYPQPNTELHNEAEAIDLEFILEDFPKLLGTMKIGAERLSQMVKSLRNFSHCNDHIQHPVNLHQTLDSSLRLLQHRLKAHDHLPKIQVIKNYGDIPKQINAYGGLLSQVFMNLLVNGIDALEEAFSNQSADFTPTLRICTETQGDRVIVRIIDNGIGISPKVRDRIFDSFFTTKPTGKGTGLGLAISQQIITEKHNGQLKCQSTPGSGTEFAIELPLSPESQELCEV